MLKSVGLFVTLMDACNLNCKFCPFPEREEYRTGKKLDYDKFVKAIKNAKNCTPMLGSICYCGSGEPLLYDRLIDIVSESKRIVPQVSIVTNGVLLSNDMGYSLIETNINHIVISITGNTPSVYENFQGGGVKSVSNQFDLVRENIKKLISIRNELNSDTQIGISYILDDISKKEYFAALQYWRNAGIDYVDTRILSKGFAIKKNDWEEYIEKHSEPWWESCCTCFGKVMNVYTDGRIAFCNCAYEEGTILGNLYEKSLQDILLSTKFKKLEKSFTAEYSSVPDFCKICDLGRARPILA